MIFPKFLFGMLWYQHLFCKSQFEPHAVYIAGVIYQALHQYHDTNDLPDLLDVMI